MGEIVYEHKEAAAGKWAKMPLNLQMGNIGSEVSRALRWKEKGNPKRSMAALDRALELFDLSIACNRGAKLREICRAREELCDYFYGGNSFGTDPVKMQKYYDDFILLGR